MSADLELQLMEDEELLKYREMHVKKCIHCGRLFKYRHGNEVYCSDKCRKEGNKRSKRKWYVDQKVHNIAPSIQKELEENYNTEPEPLDVALNNSSYYRTHDVLVETDNYERRIEKFAYRSKDFVFGDFSNYEEETEETDE